MEHEYLLLSVRPTFVSRILAGTKTVELRRVRPNVGPGAPVLIYSSAPTMALLASATVERMEVAAPHALWERVSVAAGVSPEEYGAYFRGADHGVALWLSDVVRLRRPVPLDELRRRWPWFRPPQSYRFVRAQVHHEEAGVVELAPRAAG